MAINLYDLVIDVPVAIKGFLFSFEFTYYSAKGHKGLLEPSNPSNL